MQNKESPSQPSGFQAKDHHECVSAPSEITRVWFYIYPMPQKQLNFGIPHAKFAMTLRRRSHDIASTCPTIRMTSLRIPNDTDATEEVRIAHMLYLIFLYHPGYHASIAGLHGSNFVSFLHVGDSACCRINFARC
jgi:hypothetical protein